MLLSGHEVCTTILGFIHDQNLICVFVANLNKETRIHLGYTLSPQEILHIVE